MKCVTAKDIEEAHKRILPKILATQMGFSRSCSQWVGTTVYLKCENEQLTGSFKVRGALNKLLSLGPEELKRGVVAASAGNHAQGVAYGSSLLGAKAHIVMPVHSPIVKITATENYGAEVILHGDTFDDSYAHARNLEKQNNWTFVHPFEDPEIIAGQGTIGVDIWEKVQDFDSVVIGLGGGGLIAGISTYLKSKNPKIKIYGAVTENFPGMKNLFHNEKVEPYKGVGSIADGVAVKVPSQYMFDNYIKKYVDGIISVSEDEIAEAVVFLLERAKMVVEGAGAVTLAAAAKAHGEWDLGKKTCVLLCGGNIDMHLISKIIEKGLSKTGRLARISAVVHDQPGVLRRLTDTIAAHNANVLEVHHDRFRPGLSIRQTVIDFLLETRNTEHIEKLIAALRAEGAKIL